MGLGIGTVMVLLGLAFAAGMAWLPDRSGTFAWILVGCGVVVIALALAINARRRRSEALSA